MGWHKQESKTEEKHYWLPDEIPEPTAEWNEQQRNKRYLLPDWTTRVHPNWYFLNGALVSDEYLLVNDGWKLLHESYPEKVPYNHVVHTNPPEEWDHGDEEVTVTYTIYEYIYNEPKVTYEQTYTTLSEKEWEIDKENKKIYAKYEVRDLTPEELKAKDLEIWLDLKYQRNKKLQETDFVFAYALEKGVKVSQKIKDYRQALRDLPDNVSDIRTFDFFDEKSWPTKPTLAEYYE